jgi:hypothetical protein
VLEPLDEPDELVVVELPESLFLLSLELLLELLDDSLSDFFVLPPPLLAYRSEYQPPPFKMNPAPPDTWRLAVAWWHLGHSVRGAALMDCSASQPWPQAVHAYS